MLDFNLDFVLLCSYVIYIVFILIDPCKAPVLFNRPTSHGCRSYWGCQNGQSVIMCCPDNMSYQPRKGCVPDSKCSSKCPPDESPEYGMKMFLRNHNVKSSEFVAIYKLVKRMLDKD